LRVWVFCNKATRRKVTMVVGVLMSSWEVSKSNSTVVGCQSTTSSIQAVKNGARLTS
jgi:hypothetical protein